MAGETIAAVQTAVQMLVSSLRQDPQSLESAWISAIAFNDQASVIVPLKELMEFELPSLALGSGAALGSAISLLEQSITENVRAIDWKPAIFFFIAGQPTDEWEPKAERFKRDFGDRVGPIVAVTARIDDSTTHLRAITESVVSLNDASDASINTLRLFINWSWSDVTIVASNGPREDSLPPPPPELIMLLDEIPENADGPGKSARGAASLHDSPTGIVRIKAHDGSDVEFVDKVSGAGGMKDVYFSTDKSYVVAFFRKPADLKTKERLGLLTGKYKDEIFGSAEADYWRSVFCWPTKVVEHNGLFGVVSPTYSKQFFFEHGSVDGDKFKIKGVQKEGKWFASASHQGQGLDPKERGTWMHYLQICVHISRAVRRMHQAGLSHPDLSYKNVLTDPVTGSACIIGIDELAVPGNLPSDVVGTPDFVAPEVLRTLKLRDGDPAKVLPSCLTDLHALAVLLYMFLLYRHPLKGQKVWDPNDLARDDELSMGEKALFVENEQDTSNRPTRKWLETTYGSQKLQYLLPYADPDALPYTTLGPDLAKEFQRAFVEGLHNPTQRPTASDFETALLKTMDLVLDCANPSCRQRYFVYDGTTRPTCPFCKTVHGKSVPVFDLYSHRGGGKFTPDHLRLVGYHHRRLFKWHMNTSVSRSEKLTAADREPIAYISWHQGRWILVNQGMPALKDIKASKPIPIGQGVELDSGLQLLLDDQAGGRLANIQLAG